MRHRALPRPSARLQGLSLDAVLPPGVGALLPNLEHVVVQHCALTPAARTAALDTGCSRLHTLEVKALSAQQPPMTCACACTPAAAPAPPPSLQQLATAQLKQLAKLASLSRVCLLDSSCPTLFLVALGAQLACLHLDPAYRQRSLQRGTEPGWRATLQHVARCTGLRALSIPCQVPEDLGAVAPALRQLRELTLNGAVEGGDAEVELLLGLPHLTCLEVGWARVAAAAVGCVPARGGAGPGVEQNWVAARWGFARSVLGWCFIFVAAGPGCVMRAVARCVDARCTHTRALARLPSCCKAPGTPGSWAPVPPRCPNGCRKPQTPP